MENFSDLLKRAIRKDPEAVAEIHQRYESMVLARIRDRLTPSLRRRFDTADLGQSVFADVLKDLPEFEDRGEEKFRRWLYVRAERKVIAKQRRQLSPKGLQREVGFTAPAQERLLSAVAGTPGPATSAGRQDDLVRLRRLISTLDVVSRDVVELRVTERLSFAGIAERLGLGTEDAARKRYARALVRLKAQWTTG